MKPVDVNTIKTGFTIQSAAHVRHQMKMQIPGRFLQGLFRMKQDLLKVRWYYEIRPGAQLTTCY